MGRISEKKRIPTVKPQAKINKLFDPPPRTFSAKPPTRVAPNVFAMVFRLSIAELVSSISSWNFSKREPFLGDEIFRFSISAEVTLSIKASKVEQRAETPIVRETANIRS